MGIVRKSKYNYLFKGVLGSFTIVLLVAGTSWAKRSTKQILQDFLIADNDTSKTDLQFPIKDETSYPITDNPNNSPLYLDNPSNIKREVEYDTETKEYHFEEKVGNYNYRMPTYMSLEEYSNYQLEQTKRNYWKEKSRSSKSEENKSFVPSLNIKGEAFDKIFGSNTISITPQGSAELIFGFSMNKIDNPQLTERMKRSPSFNFEEKIQMNVEGSIGERMQLGINYNTEATFEFENKTKLEYVGEEDDIIQKIEAGNVTLPLSGSLITGSQSLFGLKTELQFGKLTVTSVFSQQKGESSVMEIEGGAQVSEFELDAGDYDANRHFFLSHYFRNQYDSALQNLPVMQTEIQIEEIEVWLTNTSNKQENIRDIVAFMDLGEYDTIQYSGLLKNPGGTYPANNSNNLINLINDTSSRDKIADFSLGSSFAGMAQSVDYEKLQNARRLDPREYTVNKNLGYISLNSALNNDEILAVAYTYRLLSKDTILKVGELTKNGPDNPKYLVTKLLKGTNLTPNLKNWDLMMKNIYAIGAYQVDKEDFELHVLYQDDSKGQPINYIPEGRTGRDILLQEFGLDQLNRINESGSDGMFDFVPGVTIIPTNGRIIFPTVEPFGNGLERYIESKYGTASDSSRIIKQKYIYKELYTLKKDKALQIAEKNKFRIAGTYKSAMGSEIQLNSWNIPEGSVKVTAGGIKLEEGLDYTVDYTLGRVKILNQGLLESGTPIRVSLESNSLFNFQTKTMVGSHFNYKFNDDFYLGATIINLTERPLTKKVNFGEEPISNTIWGLNGAYKTDAPFLTKMVDKLPFIETKEPSSISVEGEFAQLIPGSPKAVGKNGVAYLDDFEGSETSIDMRSYFAWQLASTPGKFNESSLNNNLAYGYNRSKLSWYVIDPLFLRNNNLTPKHITETDQSNHFVREIYEQEIFPFKDRENNISTSIPVLNLAYYPKERGPYNYDADSITDNGQLNYPEQRWGGIMREVITSDFEAANIEYIEFWLMDPYAHTDTNLIKANPNFIGDEPKLVINLGSVSEDILKDGRKSFESGLPTPYNSNTVDSSTVWGVVSRSQSISEGFDLQPEDARSYQDVGLDGLNNEAEQLEFNEYLDKMRAKFGTNSPVYQKALNDPSSDDFQYFRGTELDNNQVPIIARYKNFNGLENNSQTSNESNEEYTTSGKSTPDVEDINDDYTMSETESYFEYEIKLNPNELKVGDNYITEIRPVNGEFKNGTKYENLKWIQFKIPIQEFTDQVGSISDFNSIRFMRMYLTGFEDSVILRFAALDLVRSEWRKYEFPLVNSIEHIGNESPDSEFEVASVNIEENSSKYPFKYDLPPGFDREIDPSNPQLQQLNEQSLLLKVEDLENGDARAVYKNVQLDLRQYKQLQMEVHAEELVDNNGIPIDELEDSEMTVFIRLGSDYVNNYYEYEVPMHLTDIGSSNLLGDAYRNELWPDKNQFNIDLEKFQQAKEARNEAQRAAGSLVSMTSPYEFIDGDNKIIIRGNPNLSNVRTIMLGVRNPKHGTAINPDDDGRPKSGEFWLNELRVTDFKDKGGWAANARVKANLADFGTFTFATAKSTPGFGSIEQKVNERDKEDKFRYDVTSNLELGKFFPEKSGISIPMYIGYSEATIRPQYNPLDPDVEFDDAVDQLETKEEKKEFKKNVEDYTQQKSINFTNVRINQSGSKPRIYDISNFAVTYAYSEKEHRNIRIKKDLEKNYKLALNYNFNNRPKNITPFKSVKALRPNYLRIIKDFNFYYLPSKIGFRTDLDRTYSRTEWKNLNNPELNLPISTFKDYNWNRYYDVKFDLSRSLKLDYSAVNLSRFDEVDSTKIDNFKYLGLKPDWEKNANKYGRTTSFQQNIKASWNVPLNKLPGLNWVTLSTQYDVTYNWLAGPVLDNAPDQGNTISNTQRMGFNNSYRFSNIYNKVNFIKEIDNKYNRNRKTKKEPNYRTVTYEKDGLVFKAGSPKSITHKLNTLEIDVKVFDENNQELKPVIEYVSEDRIKLTFQEDYSNARIFIEGKIEKGENPLIIFGEYLVLFSTGLKDVTLSYTESNGIILPAYKNKTTLFGLDGKEDLAPGYAFILGLQDETFAEDAIKRDWVINSNIVTQLQKNYGENWEYRATYEPIKGFKVLLTGFKNLTRTSSQTYIYNAENINGNPRFSSTETMSGTYSISTISIGTALEKLDHTKGFPSQYFEEFKKTREFYSEELALERNRFSVANKSGYHSGFGPTSRQVLVPSFLSTYTMYKDDKISHNNGMPEIPLPNWRVTFDGFTKIKFIEKYFRSFTVSHTYRSKYNVGSFGTNLDYIPGETNLDINGNYFRQIELNSVSLDEQFSPLIGVDMTWKNSMTTKFEIKNTRSLSLSFTNNQMLEATSTEYVVGAGFNIKDVELVLNAGSGQKVFKSDLILRADFSIKDSKTIIRKLADEDTDSGSETTGGDTRNSIKFSADYALSESFSLSFFVDRTATDFLKSTSYPNSNFNVGFSVRFTLIQ